MKVRKLLLEALDNVDASSKSARFGVYKSAKKAIKNLDIASERKTTLYNSLTDAILEIEQEFQLLQAEYIETQKIKSSDLVEAEPFEPSLDQYERPPETVTKIDFDPIENDVQGFKVGRFVKLLFFTGSVLILAAIGLSFYFSHLPANLEVTKSDALSSKGDGNVVLNDLLKIDFGTDFDKFTVLTPANEEIDIESLKRPTGIAISEYRNIVSKLPLIEVNDQKTYIGKIEFTIPKIFEDAELNVGFINHDKNQQGIGGADWASIFVHTGKITSTKFYAKNGQKHTATGVIFGEDLEWLKATGFSTGFVRIIIGTGVVAGSTEIIINSFSLEEI